MRRSSTGRKIRQPTLKLGIRMIRAAAWPAGEITIGRSKAMTRDPKVGLIFSHFIPRDEATGVDPNDPGRRYGKCSLRSPARVAAQFTLYR
jgi:hypothetical protein